MKITLHWQIEGQAQTHTFTDSDSIIIGRQPTCQIAMPSDEAYQTISRRHATIFAEGGAFYLGNLSGKNKIRVNNQRRLARDERMALNSGDVFRLGPVEFQVVAVEAGAGRTLKVRCTNLTCGRPIDRTLSVCPHCGTFLASAQTITHET